MISFSVEAYLSPLPIGHVSRAHLIDGSRGFRGGSKVPLLTLVNKPAGVREPRSRIIDLAPINISEAYGNAHAKGTQFEPLMRK